MTNNNDPVALTNERKNTHGDWLEQAGLAEALQATVESSPRWQYLPAFVKQAVKMILVKISRAVSGNYSEPDHWDDIAGYAHLGKAGHKKLSIEDLHRAVYDK